MSLRDWLRGRRGMRTVITADAGGGGEFASEKSHAALQYQMLSYGLISQNAARAAMGLQAIATGFQGVQYSFASGGHVGRGYDGFDGNGELAVGSVFGIRAWKVPNWYEALATADLPLREPGSIRGWYEVGRDEALMITGRPLNSRMTPDRGLTGHFNGLWLPGVNVAVCKTHGAGGGGGSGGTATVHATVHASGSGGYTSVGRAAVGSGPCLAPLPLGQRCQWPRSTCPYHVHGPAPVFAGGGGAGSGGAGSASGTTAAGHQVPSEHCGCGFWAYWSADDGHVVPSGRDPIHITGVVEGTGLTLIGDKGFRSEKARIVALCVQTYGLDRAMEEKAAVLEDLAGRLYEVPTFATQGIMLDRFPLTKDYLPKIECRVCGGKDDLITDALFARGQGFQAEKITVCRGCGSKLLGGRPW